MVCVMYISSYVYEFLLMLLVVSFGVCFCGVGGVDVYICMDVCMCESVSVGVDVSV